MLKTFFLKDQSKVCNQLAFFKITRLVISKIKKMHKIYFYFFRVFVLFWHVYIEILKEKKANNFAHFVNMTLKIVNYHKALTYLNMSKA